MLREQVRVSKQNTNSLEQGLRIEGHGFISPFATYFSVIGDLVQNVLGMRFSLRLNVDVTETETEE